MPVATVSQETVRLITQLHSQHKSPEEIAHIVRLKPIHVRTILAATCNRPFVIDDSSRSGKEPPPLPEPQSTIDETLQQEGFPEEEETARNGVYLGEDEYGDAIEWEPMDHSQVPNPHLMVMGESGSGKTYALQCLIAELSDRNIPSLVFDYSQSFEKEHLEKPFRKFIKFAEHLIGEEGLPIRPLQIFPNEIGGPKRVAMRVSDVFDAVYKLGDIQRRVVIDAILQAFRKVGIDENSASTWIQKPPSLTDLHTVLDEMAADKSYPNAKNATGVAARMVTFFMLGTEADRGWSWKDLLNHEEKVHVLQFRGLEGKTQRVLVELLLWHLFYFLKDRGQHPLDLFCVLDEAHHLSFRDNGPVDSLLREARKFGLGLVFASQQPQDFNPVAFSNTASKLVFQITDHSGKVSRLLSAKCGNYTTPEEIADIVSQLKQGEAFFITKNKGRIVRVADFKKRATLWHHNQ